jgi:hypothetical protein
MRCGDCIKFVSFDTDVDTEEEGSPEVSGDNFTASFRRVLTCAECGTELKESTIEIEHDFAGDIAEEKKCSNEDGHSFEVESCEASPTTETVTKDRHGKPIKSSRYMKTLYGVEAAVTLKCEHCDATVEFTASESMQASSFEELT